jgi:hypothetical protein
MTSPQDPNRPGWAAPQDPNRPGWAAPQGNPPQVYPPQQPGWGAPPAAYQPGWGGPQGNPPQGYPPQQPGWGAPQGSPPPQWGSGAPQGWNSQSGSSNKKGCLIAAVVVMALVGFLVVGCAVTLVPALMTGMSIENASNGEITNVSYDWNNGTGVFSITVAAGVSSEEASRLACQVVKPHLKGTQYENTHFVIYDQSGYQLITDQTTCP